MYFVPLEAPTMVAAAMELPADLLSIVGMNWLGRRWSSSLPLLGCGITMLACAWLSGNSNNKTQMNWQTFCYLRNGCGISIYCQ